MCVCPVPVVVCSPSLPFFGRRCLSGLQGGGARRCSSATWWCWARAVYIIGLSQYRVNDVPRPCAALLLQKEEALQVGRVDPFGNIKVGLGGGGLTF